MRKNLAEKLSNGVRLKGFNRMGWGSRIAVIVLILVALSAVLAPWLAPYPPEQVFLVRQAPSA